MRNVGLATSWNKISKSFYFKSLKEFYIKMKYILNNFILYFNILFHICSTVILIYFTNVCPELNSFVHSEISPVQNHVPQTKIKYVLNNYFILQL